jgi:hypothetical protein
MQSIKYPAILTKNRQSFGFERTGHVQKIWSPPKPGDTIKIVTDVFNPAPQMLYPRDDKMGTLVAEPRTGKPLSDEQIARQFLGQTLVFGIILRDWSDPNETWASVWPLALQQWIDDTLHAPHRRPCLKPGSTNEKDGQ